jgi:hypothetical protein
VTAPVFTVSTLGRNGRFANQLFQYAFLRICARQRGAAVATPPWLGQELFGFRDPAPEPGPETRLIDGEAGVDPDLYLNSDQPLGERVDFWGYFQYPTRHYRPHRDFLRRLFVLRPELRGLFDGVVAQLRATGRPLVALHLRRGDYGQAQFFRAPSAWYAAWLGTLPAAPEPLVYLGSEDPAALAGAFLPRRVLHAGLLPNLPPSLAFALDFYVLTQADAVAISNSSFSFMAAMLNERARIFVRPTLDGRRLVPFDPWDSPVLLPRRLQAGEQAELDAMVGAIPAAGPTVCQA